MAKVVGKNEMHLYKPADVDCVESYQKELGRIRAILKNNPKGMTVTDIAREIGINRNSVAKYLDILLISGHAEMITFGPAKVYFPSRRIPLSTMLNITADYSLLLDKNLEFIQINDGLLDLLDLTKEDIIGKHIEHLSQSLFSRPEFIPNIYHALEGKRTQLQTTLHRNNHILHLEIQHIPTTLDNGEPGVTIIIKNITEEKMLEHKLKQITKEWTITLNLLQEKILVLDTNFTIKRVTAACAQLFNKQPADCIGKKCWQIVHGTNTPKDSCPCNTVYKSKQATTLEFYEPSIQQTLTVTATPILNEQQELTSIVQHLTTKQSNQHVTD